jgi:von Willebrand factor A domain-containing protein 5
MMRGFCALYTIINSALRTVPLEHISYSGRIESGVARMSLVQTYSNPFSAPIDVTYQFPLLENLVFESFEARFGDTVVKGQVKEKLQARREYDQSVQSGYQAALGSAAAATTDIMKIEIGNVPPGQQVVLTLTYDAPLDSVYEGNWEFKIPSTLTPRYSPPTQQGQPDPSATEDAFTTDKPYTWDISLVVDWQGGFRQVRSPSHGDEVTVSPIGANTVLVRLNPEQKHYPNKDFRLVIQDKELYRDMVVVGEATRPSALPRFAALVQFMPEISGLKDLSQLRKENMAATLGEFVFILDRSGSMMGQRIMQARQGLVYFLKSLPVNSYFHVISFGSDFVPMARSLKYNDADVDNMIAQIESYDADMGGTEILQPVQHALNLPRIENYQRNIFLLTDGSVSNSDEVVEVIRKYSINNQARVFSIGIGNGCSETFIRKSAEVGSGKSLLLSDGENITQPLLNLLQESLTPALSNFEIHFDNKFIRGVSPMLNASSHVLRSQPFRLFLLVDSSLDGSTQVRVSYFDSVKAKRVEKIFEVSLSNKIQSDIYHRLFLKQVFDDKPVYLPLIQEEAADQDLLKTGLSVSFQVWAPKYTSFLGVATDLRTEDKETSNQQILIPNIDSVDYDGTGRSRHYGSSRSGQSYSLLASVFATVAWLWLLLSFL